MSLLYAVALLSVSMISGRVLYIGNRRVNAPWWAKEGITTFLILVIVGVMALGLGFLLETILTWKEQVITVTQVVIMAGIIAAAAALWMLLGRAVPARTGDNVVPTPEAGSGPRAPDHGGASPAVASPSKTPRKVA